MSKIDWSKAPEGAQWHIDNDGFEWYRISHGVLKYYASKSGLWRDSGYLSIDQIEGDYEVTPRPDFQPFTSIEDAQPATAKQPAPNGSGNPILGMVLADLTNRALEGKEKYGEPLKAHNGRNALWDAYQEALDLAMYLRQAIEEQSKR